MANDDHSFARRQNNIHNLKKQRSAHIKTNTTSNACNYAQTNRGWPQDHQYMISAFSSIFNHDNNVGTTGITINTGMDGILLVALQRTGNNDSISLLDKDLQTQMNTLKRHSKDSNRLFDSLLGQIHKDLHKHTLTTNTPLIDKPNSTADPSSKATQNKDTNAKSSTLTTAN